MNVEARDVLPDLLDDRLPVAERDRVRAHVAGCPDCAAELRLLERAREAIVARGPAIDAAATARLVLSRVAPVRPAPGPVAGPRPVGRLAGPGRAGHPSAGWLRVAATLLVVAGAGGAVLARGRGGAPSAAPEHVAVAVPPSGSVAATDPARSIAVGPTAPAEVERVGARTGGRAPGRVDLALGSSFSDLSDAELAAIVDAVAGDDARLPDAEPPSTAGVVELDGAAR